MAERLTTELGFNSEKADRAISRTDQLLQQLNETLASVATNMKKPIPTDLPESYSKAAKEHSKLNEFIKEGRKENRQESFIFRESRDSLMMLVFAMTAFGNASGNASETSKKLNESLMSGFMAFQGADFLLKSLSATLGFSTGGVSTAITAVVGLGAGLITFLQDAKKEAKDSTKELTDFEKSIKNIGDALEYARQRAATRATLSQQIGIVEGQLKLAKEAESNELKNIAYYEQQSTIAQMGAARAKQFVEQHTEKLRKYRTEIEDISYQLDTLVEKYNELKNAPRGRMMDDDLAEEQRRYEASREELDIIQEQKDAAENTKQIQRDILDIVREIKSEEEDAIDRGIEANKMKQRQLQQELATVGGGVSGVQSIMDVLNVRSYTFAAQLVSGLQQALTIIEGIRAVMQTIEAIKGIASIASGNPAALFGFASGGYTGPGSRYQPAGIVHRGEVVFEKPIVDRHLPEIMAYRRHLQGYASGGFVGGNFSASFGSGQGSVVSELRQVKKAIKEMRLTADRSGLYVAWREENKIQERLKY